MTTWWDNKSPMECVKELLIAYHGPEGEKLLPKPAVRKRVRYAVLDDPFLFDEQRERDYMVRNYEMHWRR